MKNTIYLKLLLVLLIGCSLTMNINAQIGINTAAPEGALHLNSSNQGLVYPRVSLTSTIVEAPVVNPNGTNLAIGTAVYNLSRSQNGVNDVYPGLYVWDGGKWVGQYIREDYQKFDQTALVRTQIRPGASASTTNTDAITGLINQVFTPKYSGIYKIKVSTNFGAGEMSNFYSGDEISLSTTEGDFVFFLNGPGVDIDPFNNTESFDDGWIYTHAFGVYNEIETPDIVNEGIMHYSSVVYTENLTAGLNYTFSLRINNYTGNNFVSGTAGRGYVGRDLPCSVEFTYVDEQ